MTSSLRLSKAFYQSLLAAEQQQRITESLVGFINQEMAISETTNRFPLPTIANLDLIIKSVAQTLNNQSVAGNAMEKLARDLTSSTRLTILNQSMISETNWKRLTEKFNQQNIILENFKTSTLEFGKAHTKLFTFLTVENVLKSSYTIAYLPSIETFNATNVSYFISEGNKTGEWEEERWKTSEEIRRETVEDIEYLLHDLNSQLPELLRGARGALKLENSDRARHFSISARELIMHTVHILAPDENVVSWSNDPSLFDKGRLTRRARLLYICRSWDNSLFSEFVERDIKSVLDTMDLLNRGTHRLEARYTDIELGYILLRVEAAVRFLLRIGKLEQ